MTDTNRREIVTSDGRRLTIGTVEPLPKRKMVVLPSRNADTGGKSIKGAFCNGRG